MSEQTAPAVDTTADVPAPVSVPPTDALWVERAGHRLYTGYSARGARVDMGPADAGAVFTPGELLKLALAGCAGMSSDVSLGRLLGDDYKVTITVEAVKDMEADRYSQMQEIFEIDLSGLDDAAAAKARTVAQRAIDRACTVGRTIEPGTVVPPVQFVAPATA